MAKKKKPAPSGRPPISKRKILLVLAIVVVITALVVVMGTKPHPTVTPSSVAPVVTGDGGPTPAQADFFLNQFINKDWQRIRTTYPIPDIRTRFDRVVHRLLSKEIRIHVSPGFLNGTETDVFALADNEGPMMIMQFFAPAIMNFYRKTPDQDTRDDIIVGLLLHEEYHLEHHVFQHPKETMTREVSILDESEAWWWCVETLYRPMRAQGRLRQLPPGDSILGSLRAYEDARGNPLSPAWMMFSQGASSAGSR